ncbi:hypothetical protein PRIPAC_81488 [Pristionchus pacificus]|uniref:DUF4440 domain-containing protein n=1 Tax=Pristionchus pacificus TaxID=54126 RepID=A0A2A6C1P9_PRIPA|nr:hypothetical protein PRIPAC_81488 [Pristionchus pacificus]|eukprot:PDM72094.1 hypothetical protein PRIPAC_38528 [Pristionchus pacificus]
MITSQDQARAILGPILAKFGHTMQSGNLDDIFQYYSADATLVMKGARCAYGKDQIKQALAPLTAPATVKITNDRFEATSDHIIYRAHIHTTLKASGAEFQGDTEQIWRKEDGQWKCVHDEFAPAH